ncbi:MAG: Gfo/Idh/MocA family oxidoreductase [bacterium]
MNDSKTIDIGLIGMEGHWNYVLDGIPKVSGARLVAYAKANPGEDISRVKTWPAYTDQTRIFDSYEEMLETTPLTVAVVCLPYSRNAKASMAAARRGIHVISEKPVATTMEDLEALEKVVKETGIRLSTMLAMRLLPPYMCIHRAVAAGAIGEPILASAQKSYRWGSSRPDFYRSRETYGGSFLWVGIHAVDYVRFTTGLEYTHVMGTQGNKAHPDYPGCEDHGAMVFRFANGGTADIHLDYLRPLKAPSHGDDRLRIAGSEGIIEIKDLGKRVELIAGDQGPRDLDLPEERNLFVDFVAELRGEGKHIIGPEEAVHLTRICIKAREAADTGQVVEI